jgi:sigma-B regulation protein RsbU (phosphoserine phosphatase)
VSDSRAGGVFIFYEVGAAMLADDLRITSGQSAPFGRGGDFFEVGVDASGCVSVVLADVCGNGPAAAAFVPDLRAVAAAQLARGSSPGAMLAALNQSLASTLRATDRFATGLALRVDPRSGRVEIASAGHLGPLVASALDAVRAFPIAIGVALGIWPARQYVETVAAIAPGDRLILATDGVTDALASAGDMLGQLGLIEQLRLTSPGDSNAICARLLRHAQAREDATVIVVERLWSASSTMGVPSGLATAESRRLRLLAN